MKLKIQTSVNKDIEEDVQAKNNYFVCLSVMITELASLNSSYVDEILKRYNVFIVSKKDRIGVNIDFPEQETIS